jgi:type I restriction enzyme S subunit
MATAKWKPAKLNELGFVGRGKSRHRPRNATFLYGGRYPFFQTGDIKAANLHLTEYSQTYSEDGLAQSKLWKPGTLCITIAANIAESAILGIEGCFPDSVVGFIADPDKADVRFVKYYMDTLKLQMQSISRGTTQDNLSLDKLLTFDFHAPPLPVQRRIAGILSAYDELMENSQRRIRVLEAMARALYREWFVHFRFPGHEKIKRVDSPLGKIPHGWQMKSIADICESVNYGYTASAAREEVGPKFLRITDIVPALIDWENVPFCKIPEDNAPKYLLKHGDIVVARTGATTGYAKRLNKLHPNTVFASYLVRARAKVGVSNRMLGILMESDEYKQFIKTNLGGSAQPQANAVVLTSMNLAVPPSSIGEKFDRLVEPMIDEAELLAVKIQNLRRTRDLLLPRLLSGQIDLDARTQEN